MNKPHQQTNVQGPSLAQPLELLPKSEVCRLAPLILTTEEAMKAL
jgi:hypothetical protein